MMFICVALHQMSAHNGEAIPYAFLKDIARLTFLAGAARCIFAASPLFEIYDASSINIC